MCKNIVLLMDSLVEEKQDLPARLDFMYTSPFVILSQANGQP